MQRTFAACFCSPNKCELLLMSDFIYKRKILRKLNVWKTNLYVNQVRTTQPGFCLSKHKCLLLQGQTCLRPLFMYLGLEYLTPEAITMLTFEISMTIIQPTRFTYRLYCKTTIPVIKAHLFVLPQGQIPVEFTVWFSSRVPLKRWHVCMFLYWLMSLIEPQVSAGTFTVLLHSSSHLG